MVSMGGDFAGFRADSENWLTVEYSRGAEAAEATYQAVLTGKTNPASGQIVSMWAAE